MITGAQIREGRELLGWSTYKLAFLAGVLHWHIKNAECAGAGGIPARATEKIEKTLEMAGVEFTNGEEPGVKLKRGGSSNEGTEVRDLTSNNDG